MAKKLIKKLNDREIYAKFADYASADENGDKISDRKVKSVSVSGRTMTVHETDGEREIPVVPVPDAAGLVLKSGEDGAYEWGSSGAAPGHGKLILNLGSTQGVDTGFNADSPRDVTFTIPEATVAADGLMTSADKTEFDRISGAFDAKAEKADVSASVDTLTGDIEELDGRVDTLETNSATKGELTAAVNKINTTVSGIQGDISGLGSNVSDLESNKSDKVAGFTENDLAALDSTGNLKDSGIGIEAVQYSLQKAHAHSNKATLDEVTAAYTTEEKTKLSGIEAGAQVNVIAGISVNSEPVVPDASRIANIEIHTHSNKATLDGITAAYTTEEKTKLSGIGPGAQANVIEAITANGNSLSIDNKTVDIPLASAQQDGLMSSALLPRIPAAPNLVNALLLGQDDGSTAWAQIKNDVFGSALLDETTGDILLDEDNTAVYDADATDNLWTAFAGHEFGARRAYEDQDGNNIKDTYATKLTADSKLPAATVNVDNNKVTTVAGVTGSITLNVIVTGVECANTAVELTTGSSVTADSEVTVTVNGVAAGRAAATDGKIAASKKYQVTCVGTCWTMAEFGTANA